MSRYSDLEDAVLAALAPLRAADGGPLQTLEATASDDMEALLDRLMRARPPACFVIADNMRPGALRPGLLHDQQYTIQLLMSASSFRGQHAARRGEAGQPGVYDLLDASRAILLGYRLPGMAADVLTPGLERLFASGDHAVIWRQDWTVTLY